MNEALETLQVQLQQLVTQVKALVPQDQPFGIAHNNWSFPGLTGAELAEEAQSLLDVIDMNPDVDLGEAEEAVLDYVRRIKHLHAHTVPNIWGNPSGGVPAYLFTLQGLRKVLTKALVRDDHGTALVKLRKLTSQARGLEVRLKDLEPRTVSLETMVSRIENAHETADQLPADLDLLREAREKIQALEQAAAKDQGQIEAHRSAAEKLETALRKSDADAKSVLERCETAYSAATSVGLAAAFSERSNDLAKSMWAWVSGLVVALGLGSYFGKSQVLSLSELFSAPGVPSWMIVLNLMLSLLSVGAPVWFAWLATKQIGQRFRLAEDYAFKASIARAYEGFRREAARVDKDMEARLLASALTRLDELPLRLVESDSHGSPWHELASSDLVREALRAVPGFAGQVKELASSAVSSIPKPKAKAAAKPTQEENV